LVAKLFKVKEFKKDKRYIGYKDSCLGVVLSPRDFLVKMEKAVTLKKPRRKC